MTLTHVKKAARIQLIYGRINLLIPWAVLGSSLLINIVIYAVLPDGSAPANRSTGGLASLYGTSAFMHLATLAQVFPFAVAISVTRWAFAVAMSALVLIESLAAGVVLTVLKAIESGTDGWGVRLHFFAIPYVTQHDPVLQALVFAAPLAAVSFLGVCVAAVYQRWGQPGLWTTLIGVIVVGGLTLTALIFFDRLHAVGSFFSGQPAFAVLAIYPMLLALVAAGGAARMMLRARI